MDDEIRNAIQRSTQNARALLERELGEQLEGEYDIRLDGTVAAEPGTHLDERQRLLREKLVAAVEHHVALGRTRREAVGDYLREASFTTLNRFVALKMLEARRLVQECVSRGDQSSGFKEFGGLAPGLTQLSDSGYRLYVESLFDEIGQEVGILFDRRDPSSLLWPRRQALNDLLATLNAPELSGVWDDDETIGWVYQYFNSSDERKAMRAESSAPRNSRELAVRNQFFTPRYVVRFLVDNTLGRMWWQMRGGNTKLADTCEFLVLDNPGDLVRTKKDPRDLKILDPACGSGHFLLYAFDLLQTIYEESWYDKEAPSSVATGKTLRQDFADLDTLRRGLPALILRHNVFGVEIDPRAAQIAALALWLRAQRAYRESDIPSGERAPITRTHIVVAEPMPGDPLLVNAFASDLQPPLLQDLFTRMVSEMHLAGELGTLLRVDDAIATTIASARERYVKQVTAGHLPGLEPERRQEELDLSEIDDEQFFDEAEEQLLESLRRFADSASGADGVRRWLFADDAAQGVAFIDLLRTRFDVVVMNPPFGTPSPALLALHEKPYRGIKHDVAAAFLERALELAPTGQVGVIMTRTPFYLSYLTPWRDAFIEQVGSTIFADLGQGVLDALVETCALCTTGEIGESLFYPLRSDENKATALRRYTTGETKAHAVDIRSFRMIARAPFVYWVSDRVRRLFSAGEPVKSGPRSAHIGALTQDDFRFTRLWWEVPETRTSDWPPYSKGGTFQPFYGEFPLRIMWSNAASQLKAFLTAYRETRGFSPHWTAQLNAYERYFREGVTWSSRPHRIGSFWALPKGAVFGNTGAALLDENRDLLDYDLGVLNSKIFLALLGLLMPRGSEGDGQTLKYELGYVTAVPFPAISSELRLRIADNARSAAKELIELAVRLETNPGFTGSHYASSHSVEDLIASTRASTQAAQVIVAERSAETDALVAQAYKETGGLTDEDIGSLLDEVSEKLELSKHYLLEVATDHLTACRVLSWLIGIAFGRFQESPKSDGESREVFDVISTFRSVAAGGPFADDEGVASDLGRQIESAANQIWGNRADDELARLVTLAGAESLRGWLRDKFFDYHLADYSARKRSAPIYWQISDRSRRYSIWIYFHGLTKDSLYYVQNNLVAPRLAAEERRLESLLNDVGGQPAIGRRVLDQQQDFVEELRLFLDELKLVAPLWNPSLEDGVMICLAPLWRVVPQKAWQKKLKATWDQLAAGDLDWTGLAMHLWPERVIPKCVADRSLAIAHDVEGVFWEQDTDRRWKGRIVDRADIELLIQQRTSPAVKAALSTLLAAPPRTTGLRTRRELIS